MEVEIEMGVAVMRLNGAAAAALDLPLHRFLIAIRIFPESRCYKAPALRSHIHLITIMCHECMQPTQGKHLLAVVPSNERQRALMRL